MEKWSYAEAGYNSDRSTIRCSALDTAKETPKGCDADERSRDLGQTVSLARDFRSKRSDIDGTVRCLYNCIKNEMYRKYINLKYTTKCIYILIDKY